VCVQLSVFKVASPKSGFLYTKPLYRHAKRMPRQGIISARSVQEGAFCLSARAGKRSASVAGRIKDQAAAPSERVSLDPSNGQWKVHHQIARDCVHVRADSGFSELPK